MSAQIFIDLFVDQYADFTYIYPVWLAGNQPVNFAGCTATLKARVASNAPSPVVSISNNPSAQGSIVLGPIVNGSTGTVPSGGVQVNIAHTQTALLTPGFIGAYDLLITFANGQIIEFATGRFVVKGGNNY